jgi:hypothetical protein
MKVLVSENTDQILQKSEMDQAIDLMEVLPADMIASEQAGLAAERLGIMIRLFYSSLVNSSNDSLLDQLQDPELRETIRKESSKRLLAAYSLVRTATLLTSSPLPPSLLARQVYRTISQPKNQYPNPKSLLSHSVQEVAVLLGCAESDMRSGSRS